MKNKPYLHNLVSAGGVVYRHKANQTEVVACGRVLDSLWCLPKGTPNSGESYEETAVREVQEETGLEVTLLRFIDTVEYWFTRNKNSYHKRVHFYLMSATGGDTSLHDHEFDVAEWVSVYEILRRLTYENEVKIVKKGLSLVSE